MKAFFLKNLLILGLMIGMSTASLVAIADVNTNPNTPGGQTDDFCSAANLQVCAHMHFKKELVSSEEGQFILHVDAPNDQEVTNLKVDLHMDMAALDGGGSHGTAPVVVTPLKDNQFQITNAWFVMPGNWEVRTHFDLAGNHYDIEIPVVISK